MKNKILYNNSSVNIIDYKIEEAELDEHENIVRNVSPLGFKTTGRTLEWSIKSGEKLEFPEYVANILLGIFGFLEEFQGEKSTIIKDEVVAKPEVTEEKGDDFTYKCKFCGKVFDKKRALSMHMGSTHANELASL